MYPRIIITTEVILFSVDIFYMSTSTERHGNNNRKYVSMENLSNYPSVGTVKSFCFAERFHKIMFKYKMYFFKSIMNLKKKTAFCSFFPVKTGAGIHRNVNNLVTKLKEFHSSSLCKRFAVTRQRFPVRREHYLFKILIFHNVIFEH